VFGLACIVLATMMWQLAPRIPPIAVGAGVVMHVYGVVVIVVSGIVLGHLARVDFSAPVVTIQKRLVALRRAYVVGGMIAGLPWWVLWMCPIIVLAALGANEEALSWLGAWVAYGTAIGAVGLLATWRFHRWARQPGREQLAARLERSLSGASLRRARAHLEEIERFEHDGQP